ncbi:MAG: TMEM165/GDT1 family protein [bacterium]
MLVRDFLIPFITVGIAELGDKTQLAILCLASNTKKYFELLLGVILAFLIADGCAVLLGDFMVDLIPIGYIKIISGTIFILFGVLTFFDKKREEAECTLRNPFLSGFWVVLLSEMGDKTQITASVFAAKFNPYIVFLGVISALLILSFIAVFLSKTILRRLNQRKVSFAAGITFILVGISCFF